MPVGVVAACVFGAVSAAIFFFVGISAFRSLGAAALATAAVLGFVVSLAAGAGLGAGGVFAATAGLARGRRAAGLAADVLGVGVAAAFVFGAAFGATALAFTVLTAAGLIADALIAAGLAAFAVGFAAFDELALVEVAGLVAPDLLDFVAVSFGLARLAAALIAGCDSRLAGDAAGFVAFGDLALDELALVEAVVLTAVRAFARLAFDDVSVDVLPRGMAAALAFGGMMRPLLGGRGGRWRSSPAERDGAESRLRLGDQTWFDRPGDITPRGDQNAQRVKAGWTATINDWISHNRLKINEYRMLSDHRHPNG